MSRSDKAPDGKPWPLPRIACDQSEQRVYAFGFVPAPWSEAAPVHFGEVADESLVNELLGGPWPCERRSLFTGDYQLIGPDGALLPIAESACVERKGRDLVGSLTHDRARFVGDECARLAEFRSPLIICESPIETLIGSRSGAIVGLDVARTIYRWLLDRWVAPDTEQERKEIDVVAEAEQSARELLGALDFERERRGNVSAVSLLGTLVSIVVDKRIPVLMLPSRAWAEYVTAWALRRAWRRWLTEHPEALAALRAPVVDPREIDEPSRAVPAILSTGDA